MQPPTDVRFKRVFMSRDFSYHDLAWVSRVRAKFIDGDFDELKPSGGAGHWWRPRDLFRCQQHYINAYL